MRPALRALLVNVTKKLPTQCSEKRVTPVKTTFYQKFSPVWKSKIRKKQMLFSYGPILDGTHFLSF